MEKIKFTNLAVFIIFFGIALIEALKNHNWIESLLFVILGIVFLLADIKKR